jgi:hypothetical protein
VIAHPIGYVRRALQARDTASYSAGFPPPTLPFLARLAPVTAVLVPSHTAHSYIASAG